MENRRHSKYDIPLIIVDTRENKKEIPPRNQGLHKTTPKAEQDLLSEMEVVLKQILTLIQKPLIALKYRFFKWLDGFFEDVDVPWLKLIVLSRT